MMKGGRIMIKKRSLWGYAPLSVEKVMQELNARFVEEEARLNREKDRCFQEMKELQLMMGESIEDVGTPSLSQEDPPINTPSRRLAHDWVKQLRHTLFGLDVSQVRAMIQRSIYEKQTMLATLENEIHRYKQEKVRLLTEYEKRIVPSPKEQEAVQSAPPVASGYWEEIDRTLKEMRTPPQSDEEMVDQVEVNAGFTDRSADDREKEEREDLPVALEQTAATVETAAEEKEALSPEGEKREIRQIDVQREAELLRIRYMLGKLAGTDLYDREGRLIIRKGEPITEEKIQKADVAGKLADLIIHMKLPGMEEDF